MEVNYNMEMLQNANGLNGTNTPSYYAIVPANVRYDNRLIGNAKLLYGEITALCNAKGYCWASNKYFSDLYKVNERTIKRWLNDLEEYGYIHRENKYKNGSKEVERRDIYLAELIPTPSDKNVTTPSDKNVTDNNTSY